MTSFLSNLFDSMDKAKEPKQTPKDKLLDFEKMIRDDAKANGHQPRKHLENLCKQSETFANSSLVKILMGKQPDVVEFKQTRQLKDPKTEVLVVKDGKVITIDKKDLAKYKANGYELAEAHGGKHTTSGRSMTKGEEDEKERLVKGMKKNKSDFKKRYGKDADAVMYATATKNAMEGALNLDRETMSDSIGDMVETYVKRAPVEEINKILQFIKANKKVTQGKDSDRVIMTTEDGHTDTDSMQAKTAQIAKDAMELYKMFQNNPGDEHIMTWITNKLAVAADKISSVKDYLQNPTQDDVTEYKRVEIKNKEDYMAKKAELQRLQMDPATSKNEKLKKEIIKRKSDLDDEARKMGLKEDMNTMTRFKEEVADLIDLIQDGQEDNPGVLADELTDIINGTYDPRGATSEEEMNMRTQANGAVEMLEKGELNHAVIMLRKTIDDDMGEDFPEQEELTLKDDQDFHETFGFLSYPTSEIWEAEYQGRKVQLNKPTRGDVKKFKVYVKDPKTGNVKKVNFGHGGTSAKRPTMRIRKSNPAARRSFRARHNCDNPGPKTKARYWSCRKW